MNKFSDENSIQKIQQNIKKSKPLVIQSDDTSANIKSKYGNKYLDDISDSDDDRTSYRKRNSDIINKLPEKNNSQVKKLDSDNLSIRSLSVKKPQSIKKIKESVETLDILKQDKEKLNLENLVDKNKIEEQSESNSNSSYESLEEYEFKEDFENEVKAYVKADNQISELQKQIKELNQTKKNAENNIVKHLERLGETNINITGGKLIVNKYSSKAGFKEDIVKEVLKEEIQDQKTIQSILEKIQELREENAKIQIGLKRTGKKK